MGPEPTSPRLSTHGEGSFLGIDHIPFNVRLRDARTRRGWSRKRLAEECGVDNSAVGAYEALKKWPTLERQAIIANALQDAPEYLFPPEVGMALEGRSARITTSVLPMEALWIEAPEMRLLSAPDPFAEVDAHLREDDIAEALSALTARERIVIEHYYGFGGREPETLEQIATAVGISPQRIMQIRDKGLRKLRHPSRSIKLREYDSARYWRNSDSAREPQQGVQPLLIVKVADAPTKPIDGMGSET